MTLGKKIGFVGGGNMGEAIIGAIIRSGIASAAEIMVCDIDQNRLQAMQETYEIETLEDSSRLFRDCDVVVLAVKPQHMAGVLEGITQTPGYGVAGHKLVISIAAGITIEKIEGYLYAPLDAAEVKELPIVRVMSNTPALVQEGMSGMSGNQHAQPEDIEITERLLKAMGKVLRFEEKDLDAVTAVSGSGPAYVFYLAEAMIEAGIRLDLEPAAAIALTLKTLKGAALLMENSGESLESLRQKVTTPGGTTEAALKVMALNGLKETVIDAIAAAAKRSRELSQ